MAVKTSQYISQITADTSRGPSNGIWGDCPIEDMRQNGAGGIGTTGYLFEDDFQNFPNFGLYNGERQLGYWNAWMGNNSGAALGTGADTTNLPLEGGVLGIKGGSTAIDVTLSGGISGFRLISPATNYPLGQKLWYEARVALGSIATATGDLFVGLMDTGDGGTRITSAASLCFSATNTIKTASGMGGCIGFWKRATTNPSDFAVVYNVNNGTAQLPGAAGTLNKLSLNGSPGAALSALAVTSGAATAGFIKLGFVFDPTPQLPAKAATAAITTNQTVGTVYKPMVQFFVNGVVVPWFLNSSDVQASTFPSTWMAPVIGYRSGGTSDGLAYVDWVRVAQLSSF